MNTGTMEVRLLGPVQVWSGGRPVDVGTRLQRLVLAVLALEANSFVPVDRLVDLCWPEGPPQTARRVVQAHLSRLRTALATAGRQITVDRQGPAYALRCEPELIDAHRFRALVARARTAGDVAGARLLRAAEALWRGPVLADAATDEVRDRLCQSLEETRLAALEDRVDAELRLGRHASLVDELTGLAATHRYRHRIVRQLVLALYRTGRVADALQTCRAAIRRLADELGLDPDAELSGLEVRILRGDPGLDPPPVPTLAPPARASAPPVRTPAQLPADVPGFVGRADELGWLSGQRPPTGVAAPTGLAVKVISGMAGVGKTALAVHWAHRVADQFPDGQLFVSLHGYARILSVQPIAALSQMLHALGVPPAEVPHDVAEAAALYRSLMAGRRMLVVLDNAGSADQVRPLLPGEPRCAVVVTSRGRLDGLVVREGAELRSLGGLAPAEAAALVAGIVGAQRAAAEPQALAELARACANLPLALRIAAAHVSTQRDGISGYLARLRERRLACLAVAHDEQAALSMSFDLSYAKLPDPARRLFRLLGLAEGEDIGLEAAAVLAGVPPAEAAALLDAIADGSLVERLSGRRYRLNRLVRMYAEDRSRAEDPGAERTAARHRLRALHR
jgi:DNA-binding SARP family transcriptional activator